MSYNSEKNARHPWSLRRKLLLGALTAILVLGLALGLGLGLTVGRSSPNNNDDGNDGSGSSPTASALPTPTSQPLWKPSVNSTWQIVLLSPLDLAADATSTTPDVDIFDIDLFDTPVSTIEKLHALGKKVICYFSAGSYEPNRPDSKDFKDEDKGKELVGWPGEKWLDLKSQNVRNILTERVELAGKKGCDGVDPDNVDGFQNDNGLDLTAQDSIDFISWISSKTAPLNLSLGLKNAGDIIPDVLPVVHFSVNEQCVEEKECDTFEPFIAAGKPVFHIEYPDGAGSDLQTKTVNKFCSGEGDADGSKGFSTVLKKMDLDGWVEYCDGNVEKTLLRNPAETGN